MVFRAERSDGRSTKKKPSKKPKYHSYNPYAGGIDVGSIKAMGGNNYDDPYIYGAPRAVRNPQAEARARNSVRRSRPAPPQRVAPQTTIRPQPRNRPGIDTPDENPTAVLDQLVQSMLRDSASQSFDYEDALKQSQNAIRAAYGAEINAIRSNNGAARKQTKRDRNEVEAMYAGLAATYGQEAKTATHNGAVAAQDQVNLQRQANQDITQSQRQTTGEEAKMLKDLGLEDTADQIIAPDFKQNQKVTSENTQRGARKAGVAKEMAAANSQFFQRGGVTARLEGTNRSADMLTALQDYIRGNNSQISTIRGKQSADLLQNKLSVQEQAAKAQSDADNELWDRMMQVTGLKAQIEDTNFDNSLAAQKFKYSQQQDRRELAAKSQKNTKSFIPESLQNAMGVIQQERPNNPNSVTAILQSLFNSQQYRDGSVSRVVGKGAGAKSVSHKLTPAEAANMAEKAARQAGLSQRDINIARLAAWASVEKR